MAITQYIRRMGNKRHAAVLEKLDQYLAFSGDSTVTIGERINTIQNPELRAVLQAMVDYRDIPMSRSLVSKYVNSYSEALTRRVLQKMMDDSWYNPNLSLDFTAMTSLPSSITFTRADPTSCATRFDKDGLLKVMGANLLTYSQDFTSVWLKTRATISPNSAAAPDGTATATKLIEDSTPASTHEFNRGSNVSITSGQTYTASIYLKAAGRTRVSFEFAGGDFTANSRFYADLSTGTIDNSLGGSTNIAISSVGNGWYRVSASCAAIATNAGSAVFYVATSLAGATRSHDGDGVSGVYIWGAQLEAGSVANDYSATQGTATSGPRLNYDPSTPAGTTGVELNTSLGTWVLGLGWSVSGNSLVLNGDGTLQTAVSSLGMCVGGRTYKVTYTVSANSGGGGLVVQDAVGNLVRTITTGVTGSFTDYIVSPSTTLMSFKRQSGIVNAVISNISIQEVVFAPRGLMVEEARTNLLLWSRDMTNSAWTAGSLDITPTKNQVGIDGVANSACLITEGSAGTAVLNQIGGGITAGATVTGSAIMKRGNTDWVRIGVRGSGLANGCNAWFNLATGQKGSVANNGTGTGWVSDVKNLGNGWYRLILTGVIDATSVNAGMVFVSSTGDGSGTRVNNSTYIVDFTQIEAGATASSIIPTGASTATRAADKPLMNGANFTSWFNPDAGTFVVEYYREPTQTTYTAQGFTVSDGTLSNRLQQQFSGSGQTTNVYRSGGTPNDTAGSAVNVTALGSVGKGCSAYDSTGSAVLQNGSPEVTGGGALPVGLNVLHIGTNAVGDATGVNHIQSLTYYPARLPLAARQGLTA